jgi:DNA-binding response OmpR family regulator
MSLRCLLLSSNENITRVLAGALKEFELGADTCTTAADALRRLRSTRYDALILDWEEERTAAALVQALREIPVNQGVLTIAILDQSREGGSAFDRGANFVLYKPISAVRARNSLAEAIKMMRRERRQSARMRVHIPTAISYAGMEDAKVTLLEVSQGGAALQTERKLPVNSKVYFHFELPGQPSALRLSGNVVWQDSAGRVGVRFANVPQASRRSLDEWLKRKLESVHAAGSATSGAAAGRAIAGTARGTASERRGGGRLSCELGAQVFRHDSPVPHWCKVSDLSLGGCYIEMPSTFPAGTRVRIVIRTQDQKLDLLGEVKVVHAAFGMGVEFSLHTAAEKEKLCRLLDVLYQNDDTGSRSDSTKPSRLGVRGNAAASDQ